MKLYYDQLASSLAKKLQAVYLLAGDEALLMQESAQAIKQAARKAGFTEALKFHLDSSFDWRHLHNALCSRSLFDDKQYIELHLSSLKLPETGKALLLEAIEQSRDDKLLVLSLPKLDSNAQKNTLIKAIELHGIVVNVWPLQGAQLRAWLIQRLQHAGFTVDAEGIQLLLAHTQGNLLAAAQEVEKISLIYPPGKLSFDQIRDVSNDHARFDLFAWVDTILQGNAPLSMRMLHTLKEEGQEPTLLLWALVRELRVLIRLAGMRSEGKSLDQVLQAPGIWEKRKPLIRRCLQQHSVNSLRTCLMHAARIDRIIKGAIKARVWDEIERLSLRLGLAYG